MLAATGASYSGYVACSITQDSRKSEKSCTKTVWGLGKDGEVRPVSIFFNTSFRYTRSWYIPYDLSLLTACVVTYVNHLRAESNKHGVKLPYSAHFATLTRETVFSGSCAVVGGKGYFERCSPLLCFRRFSLLAHFFRT